MKKIDIIIRKEEAELFVGKTGRWDTYTLCLDNEEVVEVNHCFIEGSFEDISVQSIWGGGTLNRHSEIMPLLEEMGELVAHHPSSIMEFIENSDISSESFFSFIKKFPTLCNKNPLYSLSAEKISCSVVPHSSISLQ